MQTGIGRLDVLRERPRQRYLNRVQPGYTHKRNPFHPQLTVISESTVCILEEPPFLNPLVPQDFCATSFLTRPAPPPLPLSQENFKKTYLLLIGCFVIFVQTDFTCPRSARCFNIGSICVAGFICLVLFYFEGNERVYTSASQDHS